MLGPQISCQVAAFNTSKSEIFNYPHEVHWEIDQDNIEEHIALAEEINTSPHIEAVVLQHEYGIFGGQDGKNILQFVKNCKKPILVTLHTVLPHPTPDMDYINRILIARANKIVVLTNNSKTILESLYKDAKGKVYVIPHGIHHTILTSSKKYKKRLKLTNFRVLSTFGLLSRSKGVEYAIQALPEVVKKYPDVKYLILGQTHPVVRRFEGESYRMELIDLVKKLNLTQNVAFYDKYLKTSDLLAYLQATDIYLSLGTNPNQAVSGTLSYAAGAGDAVISTEFTQARELVTPEIGRLVPIKDAKALKNTLLELLGNPVLLKSLGKNAYQKTRNMLWSNVAGEYLRLIFDEPVLPPLNLKHLNNMTDNFGLIQFAEYHYPLPQSGYTLDDNARAAIFCSQFLRNRSRKNISALLSKYLSFMSHCQRKRGYFVNYINVKTKKVTAQNRAEAPTDPHARAMWALSEIISNKNLPSRTRNKARAVWAKALPASKTFTYRHSKSFMIKALANLLQSSEEKDSKLLRLMTKYANSLIESFENNSTKNWGWFDHQMSYSNGIIPQSLFMAWEVTGNLKYLAVAQKSLEFLIKKSFMGEVLMPIGQKGWYSKGKKKSQFDQQPEEPYSMILALNEAYKVTKNPKYVHLAQKAFTWFLGNNILGEPLYTHRLGGCYDGLTKFGVNLNLGAESLLSYLLSRLTIENLINENHSNSRLISPNQHPQI